MTSKFSYKSIQRWRKMVTFLGQNAIFKFSYKSNHRWREMVTSSLMATFIIYFQITGLSINGKMTHKWKIDRFWQFLGFNDPYELVSQKNRRLRNFLFFSGTPKITLFLVEIIILVILTHFRPELYRLRRLYWLIMTFLVRKSEEFDSFMSLPKIQI